MNRERGHETPRELTLDERGGRTDSGAARIDTHSILGDRVAAPPITFTVDETPIEGREGEPIAVSLLAAGIRVLRTMPRFGEARGGYCMIGRCTDCMVVVDGIPNVRTCVTPVSTGLDVRTQRGLGEAEWNEPGERRA